MIAIVDDTSLDLQATSSLIDSYNEQKSLNIEYKTFDNPDDMLATLADVNYELFILDICMQFNGIDVAKKIREKKIDAPIIYTTTSKDYAIDAFKVNALDYLLKPINADELYALLDKVLIANKKQAYFQIKTAKLENITLKIDSVLYIDSNDRRMTYHLERESFTTTSIRTKFFDSIPFKFEDYNFIATHSSFIVNMKYIKSITPKELVLKNGELIPISKRVYSQVKEKYIKYLVGE